VFNKETKEHGGGKIERREGVKKGQKPTARRGHKVGTRDTKFSQTA